MNDFKRHTWHIAVLVLASVVAGSILAGAVVERNAFIESMDNAGYELILNMPHPVWLNALVAPFNYNFFPWGGAFEPSFLVVGVVLFLGWMLWKRRSEFPWALTALIIGFIYVTFLFDLTSSLVFRTRPFAHLPNNLDQTAKDAWTAWTSYPSGHTRDTAFLGTIAASFIPALRWFVIVFSVYIAWTRVYIGAHYPTDSIAGLAIGYLAGIGALLLTRELQELVKSRQRELSAPHD